MKSRLFHAMSLKIEFDYIPESNPPQIKVFLRKSEEGKWIKASVYGQTTYGRRRADVIIIII